MWAIHGIRRKSGSAGAPWKRASFLELPGIVIWARIPQVWFLQKKRQRQNYRNEDSYFVVVNESEAQEMTSETQQGRGTESLFQPQCPQCGMVMITDPLEGDARPSAYHMAKQHPRINMTSSLCNLDNLLDLNDSFSFCRTWIPAPTFPECYDYPENYWETSIRR